MGISPSRKLKRTLRASKTADHLNKNGSRILELLQGRKETILRGKYRLFFDMITKVHHFIGSPFYLKIIQEMVDIYQNIDRKPQNGPLHVLVEQLDNYRSSEVPYRHQETLLLLIQMLMRVDDSLHSRTWCLRILCINIRRLETTDLFRQTVEVLLSEGADAAWNPQSYDGYCGQNVLHILAQTLYEHPELGRELLTIFPLLATEATVGSPGDDLVPPIVWILTAKMRWENDDGNMEIFSRIEEIFLREANTDLAKGPALLKPLYKWAGEELSDWRCTSDRLQRLLKGMNTLRDHNALSDWQSVCYNEDFEEDVWKNLWTISNTNFISTVMDILKVLMTRESTAQNVWTSMMKELFEFSWNTVIITLSVTEILCLCAERRAQPTDKELQELLSRTNAMTMNDELTVAFLKTLIALQKNKHFTCDVNFLREVYVVGPEMLQLGRQLVHAVHGNMESCVKSRKLIDIFLHTSHEQGEMLEERYIEDSFHQNWLHRSPLHLAVIFLEYEKNALNCLPQNIVTKYINTKDLHGCTPLHLAHLHHNERAIRFLISHGAIEDVTDKFGMKPQSLGSSSITEDHPGVKHHNLCGSVLGVESGVLRRMVPLLIHSEVEAEALTNELKSVFAHLVRGTQFRTAKVVMGGSMREQLKAGCFDEADIQLQFAGKRVKEGKFSVDGVTWKQRTFLRQLSRSLKKRLVEISWQGIDLRPVSIHGPWKFLRKGVTVSVDVVVVIKYDNVKREEMKMSGFIAQHAVQRLQGELLVGNCPIHSRMEYCALETWNDKIFKETYFPYEWDILDSFPVSCRLAVAIGKTIVQAYDLRRGDSLRVKMPVTSYTIKTALFYILADGSTQLHWEDEHRENVQALRNALECVKRNTREVRTGCSKLEYRANPKWATKKDLEEHGEEARVWGRKIFTLIKCLAEQGWKLKSYWYRGSDIHHMPVDCIQGFGEAEYICDVCDCALERLNPNTFHENGHEGLLHRKNEDSAC